MSSSTEMKPTFAQLLRRGLAARSMRDNAAYALGRFHGVRRAYALGMAASQALQRADVLQPAARTQFGELNVGDSVRALRQTSVCLGLRLPEAAIDHVRRLAVTAACRPRHGGSTRFKYDDVSNGRLPDGQPAVIGDVVGVESDPVIDELARDPRLLDVVSGYMGYRPTHVDKWLHWSFAAACTDDFRREQGQTIDFHYDVHGYNFTYVSFYLTDCDERSGAHVYIERSHSEKPLRWLVDTARKGDDEIRAHYGRDREQVIVGKAGDGFIEDTSCYHKALAPLERDRLLLQLRYL